MNCCKYKRCYGAVSDCARHAPIAIADTHYGGIQTCFPRAECPCGDYEEEIDERTPAKDQDTQKDQP